MQELGAALSAGGGGQEAREVGVCQGCRELSTGRQGSGASGGRAWGLKVEHRQGMEC
jgi:hypothetical protein